EVLAVMFENDNEHDFNLVIDMHTKLNDLCMRIRQRTELILDVKKQGYAAEIWILESFEGILIWWNRDSEIIPRGLVWSRKQLFKRSDYSLLFGKVNLDLTPMISEQQTFWYMAFRKFYMSYIPRSPPTTYTDLFDDYMKRLSSSRKRGKIDTRDLSIIHRCDTTSVEEIRLKDGVIAKLNSRVFKLEAIIKVLGRERKSVSLEYVIQEESRLKQEEKERCCLEEHKMMKALFLKTLQEGVQRRDEKEKMVKYEEEKKKRRHELMNSDHWKLSVSKISNEKRNQKSRNTFAMAEKYRPLNTLNDQDMNLFLKDVTPWVENLLRYNRATDKVHLTDAFDIFLDRQGPLRCRFPWYKDVSVDRRFWESLVCLDLTKKGWIMNEHVELWVNYMWHFRPHDADWAMVGNNLVVSANYHVGHGRLLCAWVLEVNGHAITSYKMIVSVLTHYSSRLLGFNMDEEPIIEVDEIGYQMLSHELSLDVNNPIQTALAYREHMAEFFKHSVAMCRHQMEPYDQGYKCTCEKGDVVLRTSCRPYSDGTDDRECGYFMWMDDFMNHISSSGPSTPLTLYTRPSIRPGYYAGTSRSTMNVGKAECSNCKFLAEKIKTLEAKIKILEGTLETEMHSENHTIELAVILHELYNDMGKLGLSSFSCS
nr:phospholipase-like protein [Tanacetum cinerariifolium]